MGDSYSNCLRLAVACGYEFYGKDPMVFVEVNIHCILSEILFKNWERAERGQYKNLKNHLFEG